MINPLLRYSPETEAFETSQPGPLQAVSQRTASGAGVFSEGQLLELAAELLEVRGTAASDPTLDRLIAHAFRALGKPVDPALAHALKNVLRWAVRRTLPPAVPVRVIQQSNAPGRGTPPDTQSATRLFGFELEGLSPEDKEFELAKAFVRLAGETVRRATTLPRAAQPQILALRALAQAARREAPGLNVDLAHGRKRTSTTAQSNKERTMHNIDRTHGEYSNEFSGFQGEQFESEAEWSSEGGGALNEAEQMELATELLSVSNEAELDRFLGDLVSRATQAVGSFVRSPVGQAVGGVLKGVAKKALPMAGAAVGGYLGGPLGARIGTGLANAAGNALGLEAEMTGEDREYEGAKQFVRLAAQTAAQAAAAPPGADPRAVAQQAAMAAARQLAPGLLAGSGAPSSQGVQQPGSSGRARSGRWLRRGGKIVLYGV
jgi:hypothetical protein